MERRGGAHVDIVWAPSPRLDLAVITVLGMVRAGASS